MREVRNRHIQCFVHENLSRCIGQMLFPANDQIDFHQVIIHNYSKIICRNTIRTGNNKVTDPIGLEFHMPANFIVNTNDTVSRDTETCRRHTTFRLKSGNLLRRQVAAFT
ncbi:hypothetical protein D3C85_1270120 [compost metagenome]